MGLNCIMGAIPLCEARTKFGKTLTPLSDKFWFIWTSLHAPYQEKFNEFTQVSVCALFQLKGKNKNRWLFTLCESLYLPFSVPSRHMKSSVAAKNTLRCLQTQIIKRKLWKASALYSSIHSKEPALRNSGETTDFLLANIWRANLEGLGLLVCVFVCACGCVLHL